MASLNEVKLIGRLTRGPELKENTKGLAIAQLNLAINETYKDKYGSQEKSVTFVDVDAFGKTAENCVTYLKKGQLVFVSGKLRFSSWDDKKTGDRRTKTSVSASDVQFLDKPNSANKTERTPEEEEEETGYPQPEEEPVVQPVQPPSPPPRSANGIIKNPRL